ncbi:MAG TPA: PP2C family protein-serine/threonine phosphatase [Tepidisphaeraceae bacterium]|jgi:sigma-B regulation protein RsbU (phosphoserine phosphatase)|nr:PP2C family protein-serine/threonine phosphatase [Tepidisphaeraceae bacterium]
MSDLRVETSDKTSASETENAPAPTLSPNLVLPLLPINQQVETLQAEIDHLREEINLLRRRDETLNFYMHRMDEEMRLAARLQQDFLPKALPQIGNVHFHTLFRPAGYVSGDLYDVMRLDESHVGFYMADAVGHGMPAALLTMFIKNALVTKEITPSGYRLLPPGQTMGRLNDALVSQNLSYATFATAIYGIVNTKTLQVSFSRGGHPSPILLRGDGTMDNLAGGDGSLLGIFAGEPFGDSTMQLHQGDRLFVFTDGVEVAFADEDLKDTQRWREELYARRNLTTEQLLSEFADHIDKESGSLQPKDDLTIIAVEVL